MIADGLSVATFWLLFALPGYAVLRRHGQSWLAGGPLSGYALSSLASFALITPVSVVGYLFHLPLWVLTTAIVLAVIAAVMQLARARAWRGHSVRPSVVAIVAAIVVIGDALMGLRIGGHLGGDGIHHAGRVRMLLSYGFNNLDPLVEGRIDPIYQGNLYHALIAAAAQVTGLHATHAWAYTLFWAKLAVAGAIQYLAWTVLRDRALAWIAAAVLAVYMAPYAILLYPNTLAVFALLPLAVAFGVQVQLGEERRQATAGLAAVALTTAQIHNLYYAFVCMLLGPPLLFALVRAHVRRLPGRRELVIALLALALGLPWFGVSALQRISFDRAPAQPVAAAAPEPAVAAVSEAAGGKPQVGSASDPERYRGFLRLPDGQIMFQPGRLWSPTSLDAQLLLALGLGLFTRRRAAFAAVAGSALLAYAALYVPPLCTALVELAGAPWIVRRLSAVFNALWFGIAPGALLLLLRERFTPRRLDSRWFDAIALGGAVLYAHAQGVDEEPWTRANYAASVGDPARLRETLELHETRRAFFSRNIPAGATVAVKLQDAPKLALDCDCYPLAFATTYGSRGVAELPERRAAAQLLLESDLDLHARVILMRRYHVTALLTRSSQARKLLKVYRPILVHDATLEHSRILVLDPARYVDPTPAQ